MFKVRHFHVWVLKSGMEYQVDGDEASQSIDTWADGCTGTYPGTRPLRALILGQTGALVSNQGRGL